MYVCVCVFVLEGEDLLSFPGPTQRFFIYVWGEPGIEATFLPLSGILINLYTIHIRHITMVARMFRKCLDNWHSSITPLSIQNQYCGLGDEGWGSHFCGADYDGAH